METAAAGPAGLGSSGETTRPGPAAASPRPLVLRGDARALPLPDASVDAIVCDPPYDLTTGQRGGSGPASLNIAHPAGRARIGTGGFMGAAWDATGVAFDPATWREAFRVAKPGAHLLAFGGTRTFHRLACAIEDAGWEIRDQVAVFGWLYGSGFPKSLDVSKAIDKMAGAERETVATGRPVRRMIPGADQNRTGSWIKDNGREYQPTASAPATGDAARWSGFGTALKPAWEPIILARKPLRGTVAGNAVAYGTGALNIDGCRVGGSAGARTRTTALGLMNDDGWKPQPQSYKSPDAGRWPPNLALVHHPACAEEDCVPGCHVAELDAQSGTLTSGANPARRGSDKFRGVYAPFEGQRDCTPARGADSGGASRFFPQFRYQAKAPASERPVIERAGRRIQHPTVKPLGLMRWLCRLITPPGGLVLDMFCGSGSTLQAAHVEGFRAVGVDLDHDHCLLAAQRLAQPAPPDSPVLAGEEIPGQVDLFQ